jgi:hypothetical protein
MLVQLQTCQRHAYLETEYKEIWWTQIGTPSLGPGGRLTTSLPFEATAPDLFDPSMPRCVLKCLPSECFEMCSEVDIHSSCLLTLVRHCTRRQRFHNVSRTERI